MNSLIILLCILPFAISYDPIWSHWLSWKQTYNREYDTHEEDVARFDIWKQSVEIVNSHNSRTIGHYVTPRVIVTRPPGYTMVAGKFADLTAAEFRYRVGKTSGSIPRDICKNINTTKQWRFNKQDGLRAIRTDMPEDIDWRREQVVTPVKDQGECGSCWAFSATAAIESVYAIRNGKLVSVSAQQLVDCSGSFGNYGCDGGLMDQAFWYAIKSGGLCSSADYPYVGEDGMCDTSCVRQVNITSCASLYVGPLSEYLMQYVLNYQPVSVAVAASSWQFYDSGIIDETTCDTHVNHGVAIVGYKTNADTSYWIFKNSWGSDFGEAGYVRIKMFTNTCGIAEYPSIPII